MIKRPFLAAGLTAGFMFLCACRDDRPTPKGSGSADFACRIAHRTKALEAWEGEPVVLNITVHNLGKKEWSSSGPYPVFLSYHLRDSKRRMLRRDNTRFPLLSPLAPGASSEMAARIKAPLDGGRYVLEFDMVREGTAWFKDYGSRTSQVTLNVKARPWPESSESLELGYGKYTGFRTARGEWAVLHKLIRIALNRNDVAFEGKSGDVSAFRAGSGYPQVWLRDALSIMPASQWFYGAGHLTSWLEEHLTLQDESGSLRDWLDTRGRSDKNSVETDQESSAVQAASLAARLLGREWLERPIRGLAVLERLEKALLYVLETRFDDSTGLVTGAHTIDWGDVEDVDADRRAVYADERSRWTVDIYDQAMFYRAALDLAELFDKSGLGEKRMFWALQAQSLRKNANALLWQADRGFYLVHRHLDPAFTHDFEEEAMFALGGNVTAVLCGMADETQSSQILQKALELQRTYGLATAGGVMLPPYPPGTFKHPAVDETFEYQNGGLWDWFGGKLVYALFENGLSRTAKGKLREIIAKCAANGGLSEWDDPSGSARGSDDFAGSAGSLGLALYQGYFGLKMSRDSLSLEPKLGGDSGRVHAYLPAADLFAAYDHRVLEDGRTLILDFNSNFSGRGTVKVLLPWIYIAGESAEARPEHLAVTLDGLPVSFRKTRVLQDEFVIIETDFRNRRLKVRHL